MKWNFIKKNDGYTLVEILLSLLLILIIVFPLFHFFVDAYTYTINSKNKTVAVNVARNVLHYMEKQNVLAIKAYYLIQNKNSANHFISITYDDCIEDATCLETGTTCQENKIKIEDFQNLTTAEDCDSSSEADCNFSLFTSGIDESGNQIDDGSICLAILAPKINNENFKDRVYVYVTEYYDNVSLNKDIINLLKTNKQKEERETALATLLQDQDTNIDYPMMKLFVTVDWHEKRDNIVLEGVITDDVLH